MWILSCVAADVADPWFLTPKLRVYEPPRYSVDGIESELTIRSGREVDVAALKVAVTPVAALSVTLQVPVPVHPPPLQPPKTEPDAALAVSVTRVP
jgi:hypothetical protein